MTSLPEAIEALREPNPEMDVEDCPCCEGRGYIASSGYECCGCVNRTGECRSHCVVEVPVRSDCEQCGSSGHILRAHSKGKAP